MEPWKHRFAVIWSGQTVSILSSAVVGFSIIFWMSLKTGSAEVLALAAIAGMLPQSLLGPLVGIYVAADSAIALCTLALAVLFWLDVAKMWQIYLLLACRSAGSAFHTPAMQASMPLLVPREALTRVAGMNQISGALSNIVGAACGALLLNLTSIGNILLLDVAGAVVACTSLGFVQIPNPEKSTLSKDLWREFREGFAAIRAVPGLAWLFVLIILAIFCLMPVNIMFPLMTLQHFGKGAYEMSLIEIVWGGGALLGGAIMSARRWRTNRIVLINTMYLIIGLSLALSGLLSPGAFLFFVIFDCIEGVCGGIFNASFVSLVQSRIDAGVLGRVMSLYYSFGLLPSAIGLLGAGFLTRTVGLQGVFILSGSIICLLAVAGFCLPKLMRLDKK